MEFGGGTRLGLVARRCCVRTCARLVTSCDELKLYEDYVSGIYNGFDVTSIGVSASVAVCVVLGVRRISGFGQCRM